VNGQPDGGRRSSGVVVERAREVGAVIVASQSQIQQTASGPELDRRRHDRGAGALQRRAVAVPRDPGRRVSAGRPARQPDVLRLARVT